MTKENLLISLNKQTKKSLRVQAATENLSMNGLINKLVEEYLKEKEKKF